jgi:GDP-D-mannose dehydratase
MYSRNKTRNTDFFFIFNLNLYFKKERLLKDQEEVDLRNPKKAKDKLGWEPTVKFNELVEIMTKADLKLFGGK